MTATNTVTARNASRIATRIVSSSGFTVVTKGWKTYDFPMAAGEKVQEHRRGDVFFGINDSEVGVAPIGFMQYRSHGLNN